MKKDNDLRKRQNPPHEAAPDSEYLRHRAEQIVRTAKFPAVHPLWPPEARHVVQELHVHQIKLEAQNEELRVTREELEVQGALLRSLRPGACRVHYAV